jgi:hypothetical protein
VRLLRHLRLKLERLPLLEVELLLLELLLLELLRGRGGLRARRGACGVVPHQDAPADHRLRLHAAQLKRRQLGWLQRSARRRTAVFTSRGARPCCATALLVLRLEELLELSGGRGRGGGGSGRSGGRVGAPGDCAHVPALGAHALPARLRGGR